MKCKCCNEELVVPLRKHSDRLDEKIFVGRGDEKIGFCNEHCLLQWINEGIKDGSIRIDNK